MTYTQIIITIAAILGSGITGYWLGKWRSDGIHLAYQDYLIQQLTICKEQTVYYMQRVNEKDELINALRKTIQRLQYARDADRIVIDEYQKTLNDYTSKSGDYSATLINALPLPDYLSVPEDIIPDKDIRINTGNNHC